MNEKATKDCTKAEQLLREYNSQSREEDKHDYSEHIHNDTGGSGGCCSSLCTMCLCLSCLSNCCN